MQLSKCKVRMEESYNKVAGTEVLPVKVNVRTA